MRGILLHCYGERRDGVCTGPPQEWGGSKPSTQLLRALCAAVVLTIGPEQLQHVLRKIVSLVEVPHSENVVVQSRSHLEDSDLGGAGDAKVSV